MDLYFLRHGKAEEHRAERADPDRQLVERGSADVKKVAELLRTMGVAFDAIYSSPYLRTTQTAHIIADQLIPSQTVQESPEIQSGHFGMGSLQKLASHHDPDACLLFVGHEPDLSLLIERLCGAVCDMKPGSLACITATRPEPHQGVLRWLLSPKILHQNSPQSK